MPDDLPLTYHEVGATTGQLPVGYRHLRRSAALGRGRARFEAVTQQLMAWEMHRRAGFTVRTSSPIAAVETTVTIGIGLGPFRLTAPCRVVCVVDEPDRRGFAYGTLPGHPEQGEEGFMIHISRDGTVVLDIVAFSRPATWWGRLGAPIGRLVQDRFTTRYLRALAD